MMKIKLNPRIKREIREWAESLVIALILALLIRTFVVQAFKIPSGSMRPTLVERDRIFVNKFIYRFKKPERGDIIVFKYPEDKKKDFIKRVIALGGETIEIREGDIYINGDLVEDPHVIREIYYYNRGKYGGLEQRIEVPEDSYFVLGDNSSSSRDSRYWGFVSKKYLLGKAFCIYWPIKRIQTVK